MHKHHPIVAEKHAANDATTVSHQRNTTVVQVLLVIVGRYAQQYKVISISNRWHASHISCISPYSMPLYTIFTK